MSKTLRKLSTMLLVSLLTISSAYAASLSDISGHTNQTAIEYLYDSSVINGYEDGTFQPNKTVNRAELLKILVGGKGITPTVEDYKNCFPDVKEEWFAPFVCYAEAEGWVSGYPDGTFQPAKEVNKVEAIKMLVNSQEYQLPETVTESPYQDISTTDWFTPFVKVAKDKGLLEETGSNFTPSSSMTRAGISENIYRVMIIKENKLQTFADFQAESSFLVTNVVDGDTIDVLINGEEERIRLIGVDTPETVHPDKAVECFGEEASNIATEKLLNQIVTLESDATQGDKDKYDRMLRYVVLSDETNFNKWLISNGYGFEYTYDIPYQYQEEFQSAEEAAEEAEVGLWAQGVCEESETTDNQAEEATNSNYKFYVSSKAKTKYYCETDSAWENLSKENLLEYSSEAELKEDFPTLELNQDC